MISVTLSFGTDPETEHFPSTSTAKTTTCDLEIILAEGPFQYVDHALDEQVNEAANIVIALDYFPLALDQAGAYIEETQCGFNTYLKIYQDRRKALLARRGAQTTNYPDSVAATWSLSFQRVERANPAAAELLRLCAYLSPDRIPEELIKEEKPPK
jgi:hypothetical protein